MYTYNLPSGAKIIYNKGQDGFLEIKYKNKTIHMDTNMLEYHYDEYGRQHVFIDNLDEFDIIVKRGNNGSGYIILVEEHDDGIHEIDRVEPMPNDLYEKLIEIGRSIENRTDLPQGYEQAGGRRRKARKSRKTSKSRKARKSRRRLA